MVDASRIFEFILAALLIELTPGPNMTYLAALTVARGARVGLSAVAGVAVGLAVLGVFASLGLARLIEASPTLYLLLRLGGVAFMFWLAWDAWRGADAADERGPAALGAFGRGLVSNVLNPKAALFYLAAPPQFVDASRDPTSQLLILVAVDADPSRGGLRVRVLASGRRVERPLRRARAQGDGGPARLGGAVAALGDAALTAD